MHAMTQDKQPKFSRRAFLLGGAALPFAAPVAAQALPAMAAPTTIVNPVAALAPAAQRIPLAPILNVIAGSAAGRLSGDISEHFFVNRSRSLVELIEKVKTGETGLSWSDIVQHNPKALENLLILSNLNQRLENCLSSFLHVPENQLQAGLKAYYAYLKSGGFTDSFQWPRFLYALTGQENVDVPLDQINHARIEKALVSLRDEREKLLEFFAKHLPSELDFIRSKFHTDRAAFSSVTGHSSTKSPTENYNLLLIQNMGCEQLLDAMSEMIVMNRLTMEQLTNAAGATQLHFSWREGDRDVSGFTDTWLKDSFRHLILNEALPTNTDFKLSVPSDDDDVRPLTLTVTASDPKLASIAHQFKALRDGIMAEDRALRLSERLQGAAMQVARAVSAPKWQRELRDGKDWPAFEIAPQSVDAAASPAAPPTLTLSHAARLLGIEVPSGTTQIAGLDFRMLPSGKVRVEIDPEAHPEAVKALQAQLPEPEEHSHVDALAQEKEPPQPDSPAAPAR